MDFLKFFFYNITRIMSSPPFRAVFSYHQLHVLQMSAVLVAGGNDIDPCGVDTAVTEDVGELGIFFSMP